MYITARTLDDALYRVLKKLTSNDASAVRATRGASNEITGIVFKITDPRARLSRTAKRGLVFSPLGELIWYLSGSDRLDQIEYYVSRYKKESEDNLTVYGAYGPRLFQSEAGQVSKVIDLLKRKQTSRRAVIQLFEGRDLDHEQVPCTCVLQFLIRSNRLHMFVYMRSNDAYMGLPHDVFAFTMLQELVARSVGVELGHYKHMVGSLHLYEENVSDAVTYLKEAFQERISMPPMPPGDPWDSIRTLVQMEGKVREGGTIDLSKTGLDRYWQDLVRLLQIFRIFKNREDMRRVTSLKRAMSSSVYNVYIDARTQKVDRKLQDRPIQTPLFVTTNENG
ncbi:thymidylate synthase [Dyella monticola]|uniref:thymidylate synthase n=1 Tax=Dyella monticola TaxID=1927958 RepID=A0A370X220_9GAMM|nr:thymidylate synthase [Dyella monticola]RDS82255.1 thymidylate synthase [Dyella monticola]